MTEEHDLCGRVLREGERVLMLYQSANRDFRAGQKVCQLLVPRLVEALATPAPAVTSDDDSAREVAPILLGR